jgi:hypothetical protein
MDTWKRKKRRKLKTVITPRVRVSRRLAHWLASAALLLALLLPALAVPLRLAAEPKSKDKDKNKDKPYALIIGTVWGPDDRPVYGVKVKLRRAKDKKPKWEMYSDHMGEFAQRVPAGECDYILTADLKGVKSVDGKPVHLLKEVTVHIFNDEREDTGLHLTQ